MKTFAALVTYPPDMVERRAPHRPSHLAYAEQLRAAGTLRHAGAWAEIDGALFIYRAESREAVEALMADDPYARAGLFTSVTIREWNVVIGPFDD